MILFKKQIIEKTLYLIPNARGFILLATKRIGNIPIWKNLHFAD